MIKENLQLVLLSSCHHNKPSQAFSGSLLPPSASSRLAPSLRSYNYTTQNGTFICRVFHQLFGQSEKHSWVQHQICLLNPNAKLLLFLFFLTTLSVVSYSLNISVSFVLEISPVVKEYEKQLNLYKTKISWTFLWKCSVVEGLWYLNPFISELKSTVMCGTCCLWSARWF